MSVLYINYIYTITKQEKRTRNILKLQRQLLFMKYMSQDQVNDFNFIFFSKKVRVLIGNNTGIK